MKSVSPLTGSIFWLLSLVVFAGITTMVSEALAKDLVLTKLAVNKKTIPAGGTIVISYELGARGQIHSGFNMGIFVNKDNKGKLVKKWGLPTRLLKQLRTGKVISQKWSIQVPNWGNGIYRINLLADVDNYLKESNRKNNSIEKRLRVGKVISVRPPRAAAPPPPTRIARTRTINPDGKTRIRFVDGSERTLSRSGKITSLKPDGTEIPMVPKINIQSGTMPPVPSETGQWINQVQDELLGIIKGQLEESEIDKYMQLESGRDKYELVLWRINFINFILADKQEGKN